MAQQDGPVEPEFLRTFLNNGEVDPSDYFARSCRVLTELQLPDESSLTRFKHEDSIGFQDIGYLVEVRDMAIENGYLRRNDGSLFIAVQTELGYDITGDMFDWWFCQCDNTEKYRWWHPKDHISGTWDPPYFGAMAFERPKGHYVDHVHVVDEKLGGVVQSLQIEFQRPSKYFDVSLFPEANITAMLVGRIHAKDSTLGLIAAGYVVHMVRQEPDGKSILKSRFWLGDVAYPETPENYLVASVINAVANTYVFRATKLPISTAAAIYKHCAEEMACLREFLPHYYETAKREQAEFMQKFHFN